MKMIKKKEENTREENTEAKIRGVSDRKHEGR